MGLRSKTALTISCFFVAVIAATYLIFSHVLLGKFDELERERAERNMTRVFEQIEVITDDLRARVTDWAQWDETYEYIGGRNPSYVETNVSYEALVPFELVHVAFFDRQRKLIEGFEISAAERTLRPLDTSALTTLLAYPSVIHFLENPSDQALSGVITHNNQPLFVAIAPITDNERARQSNGFLVFTRAFSESLKNQIAKRTKLPLSFSSTLTPPISPGVTLETSESEIAAHSIISDLEENPILAVSFSSPRDIYQQGKTSRNVMVGLMGVFLIIANGTLLLFLNKVVLGRLQTFAVRIKAIAATRDFSVRVPAHGRDEITDLTRTFNALLETTEKTTLQLTEARNQAVRADRAKSSFVAHVSHELRTPIHSLSGLLRILLKTERSPDKRNLIQMARDSAATLLATINDILDLSKIESGALELQKVEFSLRQIIGNSLRNVTSRIEEKGGVSLLFDVAPGVPDRLLGDPLRLQQVLTNLLGNAAKFTHQGTITLEVAAEGTCPNRTLTVTVSDTGIGIAPDRLERIFEPYKQADASIESQFAGTGLGLSIVRNILSQLRGEISVKSVLNNGSSFTVTLPLEVVDENSPPPLLPPHSALIVTHDERSAQFLAEHLAPFRCAAEIISCDSSLERIERKLSESRPCSILYLGGSHQRVQSVKQVIQIAHTLRVPVCMSVGDSDLTTLEAIKGTPNIIRCTLPVSAEEFLTKALSFRDSPRANEAGESLSLSRANSPMRILVADDAPTSQFILKDMLEEAGHFVTLTGDGLELTRLVREAFERSRGPGFDVIITDIEMPRMTGIEASKEIRNLERQYQSTPPIPIIAITAHAMSEQQQHFLQSGITTVLSKPISPKDLEESLRLHQPNTHPTPQQHQSAAPSERELFERVITELPSSRTLESTETAAPVDLADVFERSGESLRRTKLIMRSFLEAYDTPSETLRTSIDRGELSKAVVPAHSMKGLLLDVGAREAAETAAALEAASRAGDIYRASLALNKLHAQLPNVVGVIEKILEHDLLLDIK